MTAAGTLALRPDQLDWTEAQRAALAQLGVAEAPLGDQLVFRHVAQRSGLDPFAREIYMIGRWDPQTGKKRWTIQVGIDGLRAKSEERPEFAGTEGPEWCGPDGAWTDVWVSEEPPVAARFKVHRSDWSLPAVGIAHYREFVQTTKEGKPTSMWKAMPANQIAKCAEAQARRKAFPRRLGGVYIAEELQRLDTQEETPPVIIPPEAPVAAEPDWETLIRDAENAADRDALEGVWRLARGIRPTDLPLLDRIAEAGERIKATAAATNAQPDPESKPTEETR